MRCRTDFIELFQVSGIASALARGDDNIGIKERQIAGQLGHAAISRDGMGAMFDMRIGEDANALCAQPTAVAHRFGSTTFHEALVGDIGVGPLIDANKRRASRRSNGQGGDWCIGQNIDANGCGYFLSDSIGGDGQAGGGFRRQVFGLGERYVTVVFDDQSRHTAFHIGLGIAQTGCIDLVDRFAAIARAAWQWRAVNDADQRLVGPENVTYRVGRSIGDCGHDEKHSSVSPKALVIGNAAWDDTWQVEALPQAGASIHATCMGSGLGGKGANQAIVLTRAGIICAFATAVGDDVYGEKIEAALGSEDTEMGIFKALATPSDRSIILAASDGENSVVTTRSAIDTLDADDLGRAMAMVKPGGVCVLQGNLRADITAAAFDMADDCRLIMAFNPSPFALELIPLVRRSHILFVNRGEAVALTGQEPQQAAAELAAQGPSRVIVTLGAQGALLADGTNIDAIPAVPVDVVDPTGAGDVFMATALAHALRRETLPDLASLAAATRAAALCVGRPGAYAALPSKEEMAVIMSAS